MYYIESFSIKLCIHAGMQVSRYPELGRVEHSKYLAQVNRVWKVFWHNS